TDYGQYFAWGETAEKTDYSWDTYKWGKYDISDPDKGMTKYNKTDGITTLEAADDPATANWGSKWHSPSTDEIEELFDKCDWTWTTKNGVNGCTVTSKTNGNSIFLPAAGYRYGTELKDAGEGDYWLSSLHASDPRSAYSFYFDSGDHDEYFDNRYFGLSVRAVTAK
ncbi:MAG: hypothetical protein HUJ98_04020, partial [Bacteroidaceae bacterium]|nr:hypothetical protein [Bacteroidaceae bacterium]